MDGKAPKCHACENETPVTDQVSYEITHRGIFMQWLML